MNAVQTPVALEVRLSCPNCGQLGVTTLELGSELRIREDEDGEVRELHPTVKKRAVRHACHQAALDDLMVVRDGRRVDPDTGEVLDG